MRRFIALSLFAGLLALGLTACQEGGSSVEPVSMEELSADKWERPDPSVAQALIDLQVDADRLESAGLWDEITGSMSRESGGILYGYPSSWSPRRMVSLDIPPYAIPDEYTGPVTFTIKVPQQGQNPVVPKTLMVRLEPHGIEFDLPVTVRVGIPSWLNFTADKYQNMCLQPVYKGSNLDFVSYSDKTEVIGTLFEDLEFFEWETDHFSDWGPGFPKPLKDTAGGD